MARARNANRGLSPWCLAALGVLSAVASGQIISDTLPEQAQGIEVNEKLGVKIPKPLLVQRSDGLAVDLWDNIGDGKPAILVLGYYDCPLICPLTFQTLVDALSEIDYTVGEDFRVLAVSFDPSNSSEDAEEKRQLSLIGYDREITPEIEAGFVFTVASEGNARLLADSVGYKYKALPNGEYAHPVALVLLTPEGIVSRYIYSFDYTPRSLKLALLEATDGKIGKSIGDSFLHFCFSYNAREGAFTIQAFRIMQVAGGLTVLLLGGFIGGLFLFGRARKGKKSSESQPVPSKHATGAAT